MPPPGGADRSPVSRPATAENHALLVCTAGQETPPLLPLARRVSDCGCNIVECRASTLGQLTTVAMLVAGSWDAMAKLEAGLARLERDDGLRVSLTRTGARTNPVAQMPYVVEVVAADRPGVLHQIVEFFSARGIAMEQVVSSRYRAMQTGADMFSANLTIGIPARTHIASLRDDFLEFCDAQNLDAIMDPMKY